MSMRRTFRSYDHEMATLEILRNLPLAEDILESHRHRAHGDDAGYTRIKRTYTAL